MASLYDDYYNQALDLQNDAHDAIDDHNHPQAQSLERQMRDLTSDIKQQKSPQHLDDKLKNLDHQLEQVRHQGEKVMSYRDVEALQHRYRRLRDGVRTMPH